MTVTDIRPYLTRAGKAGPWLARAACRGASALQWSPEPTGPAEVRLPRLRWFALRAAFVVTVAASVASFGESYRGLYLWASGHGVPGFWAAVWPLMVDAFIVVPELALFVGMVDGWRTRARIMPWLVAIAGLSASVAFNVGHVTRADVTNRVTFAIPPLAAALTLATGLAILKRVMTYAPLAVADTGPDVDTDAGPLADARAAYALSLVRGKPMSQRELSEAHGISRPAAGKVQHDVGSLMAKGKRSA